MKKIIASLLCAILVFSVVGCGKEETTDGITDGDAWAKANGYVKESEIKADPNAITDGDAWAKANGYVKESEIKADPNAITDGNAWALANGYVKAEDFNIDAVDAISSATQTGQGGLNFGTVEWPEELKKEAVREYLKGDASALYEDGYNHRNMFSIATSYNNKPIIGSVEFAMNDDFSFVGGSEKNTEKLNAMLKNDSVSLYWTRQFRDEDGMPSYFYSYGVEIQGHVVFYDWTKSPAELTKEIAEVRNYFKTMGAMYGKYFNPEANGYLDDAALVEKMANGATTYYKVVPDKIIITSPYMLFMMNQGGQYMVINTMTNQWMAYPFVSNELLTKMGAQVATVYPTTPLLNGLQLSAALKQMGMEVPADGLKTQATLTFER